MLLASEPSRPGDFSPFCCRNSRGYVRGMNRVLKISRIVSSLLLAVAMSVGGVALAAPTQAAAPYIPSFYNDSNWCEIGRIDFARNGYTVSPECTRVSADRYYFLYAPPRKAR